ncbi:MAG: outer membrane protein assembly factor, partial [Candidatus Accumulibacter sp.]|uniref:autotransporter assembly complex protein TamA n=1 Tax=Accumulibacter sp. TaxID=2053492 RepID=UPI003457B58E|nr:outer membrane protein assembly factor [Accumulibacter sp.]
MHKPFALVVLLLGLPAAAALPELQAPEDVRELLQRYLDLDEVADASAEVAFERRMQRDVEKLLATEGYFSPRVALRQQDDALLLEVDPGPRSLVGSVEVEVVGDLDAARRVALVNSWKLKSGQPFRQADWDDAKQSLLADLLAVDYAGARLQQSSAEVDVEARRVDLQVVAVAGPRYRFGELRISGLERYSEELVRQFNRSVKTGDEYREERLLSLQTALQNTPYFSSVSVTLERGDDDAK